MTKQTLSARHVWAALAVGLSGFTLAACSGDGHSTYKPPVVDPDPDPDPDPGGGNDPVDPATAAAQIGGGFAAAFTADPTDEPVDADAVGLAAPDPTADPIDITN